MGAAEEFQTGRNSYPMIKLVFSLKLYGLITNFSLEILSCFYFTQVEHMFSKSIDWVEQCPTPYGPIKHDTPNVAVSHTWWKNRAKFVSSSHSVPIENRKRTELKTAKLCSCVHLWYHKVLKSEHSNPFKFFSKFVLTWMLAAKRNNTFKREVKYAQPHTRTPTYKTTHLKNICRWKKKNNFRTWWFYWTLCDEVAKLHVIFEDHLIVKWSCFGYHMFPTR